ncbi:uncharacterized protein C1orf158 homolog [Exaiptasia diaphana]|uniref:Uncharacterized protein n=1 Tax=Exaiptasia diaphana TaxID=2652724 RepID=A0A913Y530_EXADI|nr:uncharacterized protein C1orf158 homolog [Exaiptasia diaphana]KXJ22585.1 Uncharacterized protein C1orf158-like [Exaiptasia diaphana]
MISVDNYDDLKWGLPGWKIEQRFRPDVLIGNWSEERRKFERSQSQYNSTNRTDYKNFGNPLPDVKTRRKGMLHTEGLGQQHIFSHHGDAYKGNTITWYDQQFNRREETESNFPALRTWERQRLVWQPEKSDFPIQGPPTNYGLLEKKKAQWKKEAENENMSIYNTTQKLSYFPHQRQSYSYRHFATPRFISTKFHPHHSNKDLHFRGKVHLTACEYPPVLAPIS